MSVSIANYCYKAITYSIFFSLSFIVLGKINISKGIILGSIFSIINFMIMNCSLRIRLNKNKRMVAILSMFVRYLIIAISLFIAIKSHEVNTLATVVGLFAIQIVILTDNLSRLFSSPKQ